MNHSIADLGIPQLKTGSSPSCWTGVICEGAGFSENLIQLGKGVPRPVCRLALVVGAQGSAQVHLPSLRPLPFAVLNLRDNRLQLAWDLPLDAPSSGVVLH